MLLADQRRKFMYVSGKLKSKIWARILAVIASGAVLVACGESSEEKMEKAIQSLKSYYAAHSPPRGWSVSHIAADADDKLRVDIKINSESDINQIKSRSRMDQFQIAKLGCPTATPALKKTIHDKTRVWVRLISNSEELALSICPKF